MIAQDIIDRYNCPGFREGISLPDICQQLHECVTGSGLNWERDFMVLVIGFLKARLSDWRKGSKDSVLYDNAVFHLVKAAIGEGERWMAK